MAEMIALDRIHPTEGTLGLDPNQIQLALAVAEPPLLEALLTQSTPAIARPQHVGQVRIVIGCPPNQTGLEGLTGLLEYERVWCMLSEGAPEVATQSSRDYQYLTRCSSDLQTLAWRVNLADAISLLRYGGFEEGQIQRILQLPWDGWHRSWWDLLEPSGQLGLPFQRWFRTRCYSDGTYTLQYRNLYAQDAPPCFRGIWQQVPLLAPAPKMQFGETLTLLHKARHALKTPSCLLLSDRLSELEAEAYMRQGVSLYPLQGTASPT